MNMIMDSGEDVSHYQLINKWWVCLFIYLEPGLLLTIHGEVLSVAADVELSDRGSDVVNDSLNMFTGEITPRHVQLLQPGTHRTDGWGNGQQ